MRATVVTLGVVFCVLALGVAIPQASAVRSSFPIWAKGQVLTPAHNLTLVGWDLAIVPTKVIITGAFNTTGQMLLFLNTTIGHHVGPNRLIETFQVGETFNLAIQLDKRGIYTLVYSSGVASSKAVLCTQDTNFLVNINRLS